MKKVKETTDSMKVKAGLLGLIVLALAIPAYVIFSGNNQPSQKRPKTGSPFDNTTATVSPYVNQTATGYPHVSASTIIDENGKPLILRGAMMESSLAYIKHWQTGQDPTQILNDKTFNTMISWNMNTLRINISQWIQQSDAAKYTSILDQVITSATKDGLYVIIDFHDDPQSGAVNPYADEMLHKTSLTWWQTIAQRYKSNPKVMYDLINEPKYPNWQMWEYGVGNDIVGLLEGIKAIRSAGAQQIIILEPGAAAGAQVKGWVGFDPSVITDQNIVYSKHDYENVVTGNQTTWDGEWGAILNHHPIYYGEWAVLPNPNHPSFCKGVTSDNAAQITTSFLDYLSLRGASWTYWDFEPYRLIQDYTTYNPTSFQTGAPWSCPNGVKAGAGEVIKAYLSKVVSGYPSSSSLSQTGSTTISQIPRNHKHRHLK